MTITLSFFELLFFNKLFLNSLLLIWLGLFRISFFSLVSFNSLFFWFFFKGSLFSWILLILSFFNVFSVELLLSFFKPPLTLIFWNELFVWKVWLFIWVLFKEIFSLFVLFFIKDSFIILVSLIFKFLLFICDSFKETDSFFWFIIKFKSSFFNCELFELKFCSFIVMFFAKLSSFILLLFTLLSFRFNVSFFNWLFSFKMFFIVSLFSFLFLSSSFFFSFNSLLFFLVISSFLCCSL